MKDNKKNKIILGLIITLFLTTFIFSFYILNNKISNNYNFEKNFDNDEYLRDSFHITKKGKYTGYCSAGLTHYLNLNVKFPKLIIEHKNATILNKQILEDFKNIIDFTLTNNIDIFDNKSKITLNMFSSYDYLIKNNIIYIYIELNYIFPNYKDYKQSKNYYYNLKDNKITSFKDAVINAEFTIDDFKKISNIQTFDDCENSRCGFSIKDKQLIPYVMS